MVVNNVVQYNLSCSAFCISLTFSEKSIALRLRGPSARSGTGRVEVFYRGEWGTICDDYWSLNDAKVACRELGYIFAVRSLYGWQVPDGTGRIWLDNMFCTGYERSLADCSHRGWGIHNCKHSDDAGVECSPGNVVLEVLCVFHRAMKRKVMSLF